MTRIYDGLIRGLAALAGAIIAAVCLLIAYDVIARNLGLTPPASTVALTEYALLYFTMATAPYLVRVKGHIVVEIIYTRLGPAVRRGLDRSILLLCMLICLMIAILASLLMVEAIMRGEIEIRSMDAPRWVLFAPLVAGFALMGTEFLRLFVTGDNVCPAPDQQRERF